MQVPRGVSRTIGVLVFSVFFIFKPAKDFTRHARLLSASTKINATPNEHIKKVRLASDFDDDFHFTFSVQKKFSGAVFKN